MRSLYLSFCLEGHVLKLGCRKILSSAGNSVLARNKFSFIHVRLHNYKNFIYKFFNNLVRHGKKEKVLGIFRDLAVYSKHGGFTVLPFILAALDRVTPIMVIRKIRLNRRRVIYRPNVLLAGRRLKLAVKYLLCLQRIKLKRRRFSTQKLFSLLLATVCGRGIVLAHTAYVSRNISRMVRGRKPRFYRRPLFLAPWSWFALLRGFHIYGGTLPNIFWIGERLKKRREKFKPSFMGYLRNKDRNKSRVAYYPYFRKGDKSRNFNRRKISKVSSYSGLRQSKADFCMLFPSRKNFPRKLNFGKYFRILECRKLLWFFKNYRSVEKFIPSYLGVLKILRNSHGNY